MVARVPCRRYGPRNLAQKQITLRAPGRGGGKKEEEEEEEEEDDQAEELLA